MSERFTDTGTSLGGGFTNGTVVLTAQTGTSALTLPRMAPGNKVTAPITVTNAGTLEQRYSVTSLTTGSAPLAARLRFTIKTGVTACTNGGFGMGGIAVYGPGVLGTTAGTNVIGDSAVGPQAGDRMLALDASEVLCAQVELPVDSDNSFKSLTAGMTLTFNAEEATDSSGAGATP